MRTLTSTRLASETIVIVYNADDGLFHAFADSIRKIFSPETYECTLCAITHGPVGMLRPWKRYLRGLGRSVATYHRKDFQKAYDRPDLELPAILMYRGGDLEVLLSAAEIGECRTLESLVNRMDASLARLG